MKYTKSFWHVVCVVVVCLFVGTIHADSITLQNQCPSAVNVGHRLHPFLAEIQRACSYGSRSACDQAVARSLEGYHNLFEMCYFNTFVVQAILVPDNNKVKNKITFVHAGSTPKFRSCVSYVEDLKTYFLCEYHATPDPKWSCVKRSGEGVEDLATGRLCMFKN